MHYYVDGYNLLFSCSDITRELKHLRQEMIEEINEKAEVTNTPITIVFDAHYCEGEFSITHYKQLEIIYTSYEESADELIISLLRSLENPKAATLVTSDNSLAWNARHLLVKTMKVDAFLELLDKRSRSKKEPCKKPQLQRQTKARSREEAAILYYEKIFNDRLIEMEDKKKK